MESKKKGDDRVQAVDCTVGELGDFDHLVWLEDPLGATLYISMDDGTVEERPVEITDPINGIIELGAIPPGATRLQISVDLPGGFSITGERIQIRP